jgi:hypothetical protein
MKVMLQYFLSDTYQVMSYDHIPHCVSLVFLELTQQLPLKFYCGFLLCNLIDMNFLLDYWQKILNVFESSLQSCPYSGFDTAIHWVIILVNASSPVYKSVEFPMLVKFWQIDVLKFWNFGAELC